MSSHFQTFKASRFLRVTWQSNDGDATSYNISLASTRSFAPNNFFGFGDIPEQRAKFYNYMNMYQEYRIKEVNFHYLPRWRVVNRVAAINGSTNGNAGGNYYSGWTDLMILMGQDHEDLAVRDDNQDEFFQSINSGRFTINSSTQEWNFKLRPTIETVVGNDADTEKNFPTLQSPTGGITNAVQDGPVQVMPWMSTKVTFNQVNNVSSLIFNDSIQALGLKIYVVNPFNPSSNSDADDNGDMFFHTIGSFIVTYTFEFKIPETRAPLTLPTLTFTAQEGNNYKKPQIEDFRKSIEFQSMPASAAAVTASYKRAYKEMEDDPTQHAVPPPKVPKASQAQSSQNTPAPPAPQSFRASLFPAKKQ